MQSHSVQHEFGSLKVVITGGSGFEPRSEPVAKALPVYGVYGAWTIACRCFNCGDDRRTVLVGQRAVSGAEDYDSWNELVHGFRCDDRYSPEAC